MKELITRNRKIYRLRQNNQAKWTYRNLAKKFGIAHTNIIRIVKQEAKKKPSLVKDEAI